MRSLIVLAALVLTPAAHAAGPGTELANIFKARGFDMCAKCVGTANRMDQMGTRAVWLNRRALTREVVANARAKGHHMGPLRRVGVRLAIGRAVARSRR